MLVNSMRSRTLNKLISSNDRRIFFALLSSSRSILSIGSSLFRSFCWGCRSGGTKKAVGRFLRYSGDPFGVTKIYAVEIAQPLFEPGKVFLGFGSPEIGRASCRERVMSTV